MTTQPTQDEYTLEHIKSLSRIYAQVHAQGTTIKQVTALSEEVAEIITQIYEDGYNDGFKEREALGDLNPPKGGHYPH